MRSKRNNALAIADLVLGAGALQAAAAAASGEDAAGGTPASLEDPIPARNGVDGPAGDAREGRKGGKKVTKDKGAGLA